MMKRANRGTRRSLERPARRAAAPAVLAALLVLAWGCSGADDGDACALMCQRLAGCGLCLTDAQDNCLTVTACSAECGADPELQRAAVCINGTSGCTAAPLNACLEGGGSDPDGGTVPVGAWTFTGDGTFKETQTYLGQYTGSCAVKVPMTATVNVKVSGWVELSFQVPEFQHMVDTTGPAGTPPRVTCTKGATLEGKSFYASSHDRTARTFTLQRSSVEGPWLKGSFDAARFRAQGSHTAPKGINATLTTVLDVDLPRRQ